MKYLRLFESFENIDEICRKYKIENYTINTDGSIDVDGHVDLSDKELTKLPLKFNKINKYFDCNNNKLTSLEGSPVEVNNDFYCNHNKLTSFKFAPKIIRGQFDCSNNNIKTFEYFPSFVKGDFFCYDNSIWDVWILFLDCTKIELLNDFDIFRDEDTDEPKIFIDRLNDFIEMIGKPYQFLDKKYFSTIKKVEGYKNIYSNHLRI